MFPKPMATALQRCQYTRTYIDRRILVESNMSLLQIGRSINNFCYAKESLGFRLFVYASPPGFEFGFDFGAFRRIAVSTVINKSMLIKAISRKRRAHNAGVYYNLFN